MKNNKRTYTIIAIAIVIISISFVWEYVNKSTKDYRNATPEQTFDFTSLMKKIETDTTQLRNHLIAVTGPIKMITKDSDNVTIEIGYDSIMSSITCQIDKRHVADFKAVNEGNIVGIKGIVSDMTIDPESIFGNTLQMTYCTIHKNK
ncbi:MAG: hypothetical protein IPG85_11765 [Bacteroidetes bacterium]|jgi:hypothetical protein|nr:hypothetical protein [Bacteroidota bacterium]